jgi:hypothetical protein
VTPLRMFVSVIAISVLGGTAGYFTGGAAHDAISYVTPMAVGVVMGLYLAAKP